MRRVNVPLLLLFLGVAASARANDFIFSEATAPVVFPLMLLWAFVGFVGAVILQTRGIRLDVIGLGAVLSVVIFVFLLMGHVEFVAMIWMIYLALSTVYYAFPRANLPPAERRANFIYHGTFLALVIVGGAIAKVVYYSKIGGYSRWLGATEEYYVFSLMLFGYLMVLVLPWFYAVRARASRRRAAERSAPPSGSGPS